MLERLFPFLDIAVLEQDSDQSFKGITPFPSWFLAYFPDAKPQETSIHLDWPFLADFLSRAVELWNGSEESSVLSGPWNESDASGKDKMLQATAVLASGRKLLVLEPARVPLEEAQVLLQKGRQKNLDYRTVKRKQQSLRKVQQRYLTLLDAVPDWLLVVHEDGSLLEYSSGRAGLFADIQLQVGKNINHLLPPDFAEELFPQIQNVISSGRPQMWRYRGSQPVEVLVLATGSDEALCILRPKNANS